VNVDEPGLFTTSPAPAQAEPAKNTELTNMTGTESAAASRARFGARLRSDSLFKAFTSVEVAHCPRPTTE